MPRGNARVAGGRLAGRPLFSPAAASRPATALIRKALFDRPEIARAAEAGAVLDLYAGAGYLGIEALSHGAERVDFVERDGAACRTIRRNLEVLGLAGRARVHRMPVERAFGRVADGASLAFLDPPFAVDARAVAERLGGDGMLDEGAILVWRRRAPGAGGMRAPAPERIGRLVRIDQRRYGESAVDTYICGAADRAEASP